MTKKSSVLLSSLLVACYLLLLGWIYPFADQAFALIIKTGIPVADIATKKNDIVIGVSYIGLLLLLFGLLDILTRYRLKYSLFGFLFTNYTKRKRQLGESFSGESFYRFSVCVCTFFVVPLLALAFLRPNNVVFLTPHPANASFLDRLFVEDGLMEWTTFLSFATAGILVFVAAIIIIRIRIGTSVWLGCFLLGLGACVWLVALEEISWGQRLFGWSTPELIGRYNVQNETNIHNIISLPLSRKIDSTLGVRLYFLVGIGLFLISWFSCLADVLGKSYAFKILPHSALVFLAAEISIFSQLNMTNELLEPVAGIYVIFLSLQYLHQARVLQAKFTSVHHSKLLERHAKQY